MDLERKMIGYGKDKERLWYLCIRKDLVMVRKISGRIRE